MYDTDDEAPPSESGYTTPPLSPTKTVSTEGWTSPRTPVSPRKTRSCLFFHDLGSNSLLPTPPDSPTKSNLAIRPGALKLADVPRFLPRPASPSSDDDSPLKKRFADLDSSPLRRSIYVARSNSRSSPDAGTHLNGGPQHSCNGAATPSTAGCTSSVPTESNNQRPTIKQSLSSPTPVFSSAVESGSDSSERPSISKISDHAFSPTTLRRLPLRHSSSPLRPSQWVARGGQLSSPRHQTRTPDRFIPSRRPPHVTRESFELNKPAERLAAEERITRGGTSSLDPFSRRLHRSDRLNDELRSLRETHSVLTGRANPNRRGPNASLRRGSYTIGARQISAGAVWNVGGASAVSDTIVGVSNGRGGMLGSGTNAPLYTSMFLSRSDPEAELEAYERRLAHALDVDQTDRVLEHSTRPGDPFMASPFSAASPPGRTTHVWKDNAWTKDGVAARSFSLPASRICCADYMKAYRRSRAHSRKAVPILPFRYVETRLTRYLANSKHSSGRSSATR